MNTSKEKMAVIVRVCGTAEAHRLVMDAYNAEIISNRLGRLEPPDGAVKLARPRQSLVDLAIDRVHEVVTFGD